MGFMLEGFSNIGEPSEISIPFNGSSGLIKNADGSIIIPDLISEPDITPEGKKCVYITGIGTRNLDERMDKAIRGIMKAFSSINGKDFSFILRSGGARGADTAFECSFSGKIISYRADSSHPAKGLDAITYSEDPVAEELVMRLHPNPGAVSSLPEYSRKLLYRDAWQIIGSPGKDRRLSDFVIAAWPMGTTMKTALLVAKNQGVPVFNVSDPADMERLRDAFREFRSGNMPDLKAIKTKEIAPKVKPERINLKISTGYFGGMKNGNYKHSVSIALWTPDGINIPSYRKLAPTKEILQLYKDGRISEKEYIALYEKEVLSKVDPEEAKRDLIRITGITEEELRSGNAEVTLLCFEKPRSGKDLAFTDERRFGNRKDRTFCHRYAAKEHLDSGRTRSREKEIPRKHSSIAISR